MSLTTLSRLFVSTVGGRKHTLVSSHIIKLRGDNLCYKIDVPLDTIPTKDRFALITVYLKGEPYIIVDIGLRMLQPHELYAGQGFTPEYIIDKGFDGKKISKVAQVRMCGNSVCPPLAQALVKANYFNGMLNEQRKIA